MTDVLFERLKKRFPAINGHERVFTYGAYERIHLDLIDELFINAPEINPRQEIKGLASRIFDVKFICKGLDNGGIKKLSIIFIPQSNVKSLELFKYYSNYEEHRIDVNLPAIHPEITISTANRGAGILLAKQRNKYFKFVEEVYQIFLDAKRT